MHYVRSVEGRLVTRYGTSSHIGAVVVPGGKVDFTDEVVAISDPEWTSYLREYSRHLKNGDLELATEAEFKASNAAIAREQQTAFERGVAETKAAEAKAAEAAAKQAAAERESAEKAAAEKRARREAKQRAAQPAPAETTEPTKKDP